MHRGRPRSRKPVEVHTQINTINSNTNKTPASATPATAILPDLTVSPNAASSQHLGSADLFQQPLFYQPSHHKASPLEADISASSYKEPRYLEWMMKGETSPVASSNQQWQQLMPSKFGLTHDGTSYNGNAPSLQQHYQEPLSLNSYTEFGSQGPKNQQHNDEGCLFVSTEDPRNSDREQTPRRFIDAWSTIVKDDSTGTGSKSSVTSSAKLSLSSLALSMSGGRGCIREDMGHIQMGLGINDSDPNRGGGGKSQALSWMNSSPVSWMASPPGGPLAEALGTGTTGAAGKTSCAVGLNLMRESCGGSPQATTMSSPSGVITRTLASLSDSSGSSSPTFAAAAVSGKPDTALQWLSRTKLESS